LLLNRLRPIGAPWLALRAPSLALRAPCLGLLAPSLRLRIEAAVGPSAQPELPVRLRATDVRLTRPGEALSGAKAAARKALQALQRQLVCELVNRNTNLLGDSALNGDVLRQLSEYRGDLV